MIVCLEADVRRSVPYSRLVERSGYVNYSPSSPSFHRSRHETERRPTERRPEMQSLHALRPRPCPRQAELLISGTWGKHGVNCLNGFMERPRLNCRGKLARTGAAERGSGGGWRRERRKKMTEGEAEAG